MLSLIERGLSDIDDCIESRETTNSNNNDDTNNSNNMTPFVTCSCRAEMNSFALQKYILRCAQCPEGGFRGISLFSLLSLFLLCLFSFYLDKPGKSRDFYHT